ncbi:hypothetical protein EZV62_006853 [Acer yangbiense]|uniref:Kinesin motor domain-containing protein n=1 Tax=Acer yangbiense TaxID=1000413 RepID=A0A5C7I8Z2_9ROSI|nr:hypothetical protein EZV62_006853 [Acer yangbiense]
MGNLRELWILNGSEETKKKEFCFDSIAKLERLEQLGVKLDRNDCFASLQPLTRCSNLKDLRLYGKIKKLPEDIHNVLPNLECLSLTYSLLKDDPMPLLEKLDSLMILNLGFSFYSGKNLFCSAQGFRRLEILKLEAQDELEELQVEEEAMPMLRGLSIPNDSSLRIPERFKSIPPPAECEFEVDDPLYWDSGDCEGEGSYERLKRDYECQKKELAEAREALEELKRENQLKSTESHEAVKSLQELQNELMRKSMHVGSLAFAIEGQVKEKSKWFSSLRDLTRKLKIMKMEQIKLSEEASAHKKCVADMNEMSSTIQSTINHQVDLYEHLKVKFINGTKQQKELYNKVLELKGNIRVFCRCRPLNREEVAAGAAMAIDFDSSKDGELTVISNGAPKKTFKFDAVFGPQAGQADVFEDTAPFATSVLDGYNVCIFAYGQNKHVE